jgi:hypothetical protein
MWARPLGVPSIRTLRARFMTSARQRPSTSGWGWSTPASSVSRAPAEPARPRRSKPVVKAAPALGDSVGATEISSPLRQPDGACSRVIAVALLPIAVAARVQPVLGVPARSSRPGPMTQRPTSVSSGTMPPPWKAPSSTSTKRSRCRTEPLAGFIASRPSTTTFLVDSRVALCCRSKASVPPPATWTPATRTVAASTDTVVPAATLAVSVVPGSRPPQTARSVQLPDLTDRTTAPEPRPAPAPCPARPAPPGAAPVGASSRYRRATSATPRMTATALASTASSGPRLMCWDSSRAGSGRARRRPGGTRSPRRGRAGTCSRGTGHAWRPGSKGGRAGARRR